MTTQASRSPDHLVWMDLEMTGLDPARDVILQAALIITNSKLEILDEYVADVWQPESELAKMVPFVRQMHEKTGLLERLRQGGIELRRVEQELLYRVSELCPAKAVLCGNTIHSDRKFIDAYMPALAGYLHYRMVDVSSLKILSQAWAPESEQYKKPKDGQHDALFDVRQSIAELAHYKKHLFREF